MAFRRVSIRCALSSGYRSARVLKNLPFLGFTEIALVPERGQRRAEHLAAGGQVRTHRRPQEARGAIPASGRRRHEKILRHTPSLRAPAAELAQPGASTKDRLPCRPCLKSSLMARQRACQTDGQGEPTGWVCRGGSMNALALGGGPGEGERVEHDDDVACRRAALFHREALAGDCAAGEGQRRGGQDGDPKMTAMLAARSALGTFHGLQQTRRCPPGPSGPRCA